MDIGFETIGNATLICYDRRPVLASDPWIEGSAYFGAWGHSHEIPREQYQAVMAAEYIFFSHGHPDHLNPACLPLFKGKTILLADHVGGRIKGDLEKQGFQVRVLQDRSWVKLSERISILTISDYLQDSVLLVDINGRLVVNTNDCGDHGWGRFVRKIASHFPKSFLLCLAGFGDTDMLHFVDEQGKFVTPTDPRTIPLGEQIAEAAERYGVNHFIPFSSMHTLQRADNVWAKKYSASVDDMQVGFKSKSCRFLTPFIQYDCGDDDFAAINPRKSPEMVFEPTHFGDNWNDLLTKNDVTLATNYFHKVEHLMKTLSFINLRVGGKDNIISMGQKGSKQGVTFEAPRNSLMTCLEYEIFDDILIGNYTKTTLHGNWPTTKLYPEFVPYLCKFSDNGRAHTEKAVKEYLKIYESRAMGFRLHQWDQKGRQIFTKAFPRDTAAFLAAKKVYSLFRKLAA